MQYNFLSKTATITNQVLFRPQQDQDVTFDVYLETTGGSVGAVSIGYQDDNGAQSVALSIGGTTGGNDGGSHVTIHTLANHDVTVSVAIGSATNYSLFVKVS